MANNTGLSSAKEAKKDEFYTRWEEIELEVNAYLEYDPDVFRGKTILLPADDPFESNFFKFFATHFNDYGLKKLISTSYDPSPIVNTQLELSLFDDSTDVKQGDTKKFSRAYKIELTSVDDFDHNGRVNIDDVELALINERKKIDSGKKSSILSFLNGDANPDGKSTFSAGDFRSQEVTALKDEADIIITNPPFSLFRDFMAWVNPNEKKFLILGNVNAVSYKEVFPLFQNNVIWFGSSIHSGDRMFYVPDSYPLDAAGSGVDANGRRYIRVKGVRWYTNLDHGRRHQPLSLMSKADNLKFNQQLLKKFKKDFDMADYPHYDNYDALEVPFTSAIPGDYPGVMGVPLTFLDKYNPEQFEIIGLDRYTVPKEYLVGGRVAINGKPRYARILIKKRS